jgi:heme exporter protein C
MSTLFAPASGLCAIMLAATPFVIASAPYESTMGLVQKIFYYHVPSAWLMMLAALVSGTSSGFYLFNRKLSWDRIAVASAELMVLFGAIVLITGPLWGRKAWGVWWQWDARLTSSLTTWMIFCAYLIVRRFGGIGSEKLAAGLALFGLANVPFIYVSVNYWRTIHPTTNVVPTLPLSMGGPFWFCALTLLLLYVLLMQLRIGLEEQRTQLDDLYLAVDK